MDEHERTVRFRRARRDPQLTVVEGFHALKHALRFGAELLEAVAVDPAGLEELAGGAGARPRRRAERDGGGGRRRDAGRAGAAGAAHRGGGDRPAPAGRPGRGAGRPAPGAAGPARAAAQHGQPRRLRPGRGRGRRGGGADAAARTTPGPPTPCAAPPGCSSRCRSPRSRRCRQSDRGRCWRSTPRGRTSAPSGCPPRAVLAFGTERHGLSAELLERADARVAIPMRAGVSSLNLATSVAVVLFCRRAWIDENYGCGMQVWRLAC